MGLLTETQATQAEGLYRGFDKLPHQTMKS